MKQIFFLIVILANSFLLLSQDTSKQNYTVGLTMSLPWANSYSYYDYDINKASSKSGFVGLGASAFHKNDKRKFSLNMGFTGDSPAPIGGVDYAKEGTRTHILTYFLEGLYHKNIFKRVTLIGGLNFVNYRFNFESYVDSLPSYFKNDKTTGLTLGCEYRLLKNTNVATVALFYRPAIISFNQKNYRHLISLDARFDITLWKNN